MDEELDPLTGFPVMQHLQRLPSLRKKPSAHPPLSPEAEQSLLSQVLGTGTSALQYIGETLDKPGRAVRQGAQGVMKGDLGQMASAGLNMIPFSDTIGLTDPSKAVSGRDLLETAGLVNPNKPGLADLNDAAGDVAGFGVEVLTDPLSYLTFGASALGKAGKVAKAAGISTKGLERFKTLDQALFGATPELLAKAEAAAVKHGSTLEKLRPEKLGGALGWTTGPLGLLGIQGGGALATGAKGEAAIKGLGKATDFVGNLPGIKQITTSIKGGFGHKYQGVFDPVAQPYAKTAYESAAKLKPDTVLRHLDAMDEVGKIIKDFHAEYGDRVIPGVSAEDAISKSSEIVRRAIQELGSTQGKAGAFDMIAPHLHVGGDFESRAAKVGSVLQKVAEEKANKYLEMGGDMKLLQQSDAFNYFPRAGNEKLGYVTPFTARRDAIRYASPEQIEKMMHDVGLIWGRAHAGGRIRQVPTTVAANLKARYADTLDAISKASGKEVNDVAEELSHYIHSHSSSFLRDNTTFFKPDPLGNVLNMEQKMNTKLSNLDAIHSLFKNNLADGVQDSMSLTDAYTQLGLNTSNARKYFEKAFGLAEDEAKDLVINKDAFHAAQALKRASDDPQWLKKYGEGIDKFNRWFKQNVTLPFPSFMSRNFVSGQWMNLASGEIGSSKQMAQYFGSLHDVAKMLKNPDQHRKFFNAMEAYGAIDQNVEAAGVELLNGRAHVLPHQISPQGVLQNFTEGWKDAGKEGFGHGPGVLSGLGAKIPGSKYAVQAAAAPAQVGKGFNHQIEYLNRAAMFHYLTEKAGWTAEAAAQKTRQLQVAYEELAPFEKQIMRRLVPFYTYSRKIFPVMFEQMSQRPGGVTAQTVRLSNAGRSKDEFVPPYVGEGMSVNLGGDKYLSGLGLPTDQLADLFVKGPTAMGTLRRTGQKYLAMTNPLFKAPLEVSSGQNFFTGRPIEESFPDPTNNLLLNQAIHNSPASRLATTLRQWRDPRKDIGTKLTNSLTGLRITDVSGGLEKQQRMAEGKLIAEMLKESPNIRRSEDVYPAKDRDTGLPVTLEPQEEKLYRVYLALKRKAAEESKRKKQRPTAGVASPE